VELVGPAGRDRRAGIAELSLLSYVVVIDVHRLIVIRAAVAPVTPDG